MEQDFEPINFALGVCVAHVFHNISFSADTAQPSINMAHSSAVQA